MRRLALLIVALTGCPKPEAPPQPPPAAPEPPDPKVQLGAAIEAFYEPHLAAHPAQAIELGYHKYDGKLPDLTRKGVVAEVARLKQAKDQLEAIDPGGLEPTGKVEREILLHEIRKHLFDLETWQKPNRDPMFYTGQLGLTAYISRDYAPIEQRAQAIIWAADATPALLEAGKQNLAEALPRTWVQTALLQSRGAATFVRTDVPAAMAGLADPELKTQLDTALAKMATAIDDFTLFLEGRLARSNTAFPLGETMFLQMLRDTQGVDIEIDRLLEVGQADLARNLAALEAAAKEISARRPVAKTVARVMRDKPRANKVLAEAARQGDEMRQFLIDQEIVTIPSEDVAEVRVSPPFQRWNAAFLDGAGPFEEKPLPSFYYISPPDPAWPRAKRKAYIPGRSDLLFITIHELWPGHFLHSLHVKKNESKVMKSFWNYAMGEGWAHYTEEMMWEAGISDSPKVRIGQLLNALLRDVRYLSAIGLHTRGMTVEQSLAMFQEKAFQDPGNAQQQAVRGTFDPMYLSYTLGKLMILKLRQDYQAKAQAEGKAWTLLAFHDELLSYGAAPLPVIREAMLGPDAGPPL